MIFELQGADGMRDSLKGVFERVREIIHGINAPLVARAVMGGAQDAVDDGIAHIDVGRRHVYLGAQDLFSVRIFALFHLREKAQIFLYAPLSPRAVAARGSERAARRPDLFGGIIADVGKPLFDQLHRAVVHAVEIVGRIKFRVPLKAQPGDVFLDGIDVFHVFLAGIGVVVTQIAPAAVFRGDAEVYADGFGVTDMQIAVRLGGKAGYHLFHLSRGELFFHDVFDKIARIHVSHFFSFVRTIPLFRKFARLCSFPAPRASSPARA